MNRYCMWIWSERPRAPQSLRLWKHGRRPRQQEPPRHVSMILMVPTLRVVTAPWMLPRPNWPLAQRWRPGRRASRHAFPRWSVGTIGWSQGSVSDGSHAPRGNRAVDAPASERAVRTAVRMGRGVSRHALPARKVSAATNVTGTTPPGSVKVAPDLDSGVCHAGIVVALPSGL